ncbi:MAG: hypothetical protein V3S55_08595, partial [Nitrospiraceae bacterium]
LCSLIATACRLSRLMHFGHRSQDHSCFFCGEVLRKVLLDAAQMHPTGPPITGIMQPRISAGMCGWDGRMSTAAG